MRGTLVILGVIIILALAGFPRNRKSATAASCDNAGCPASHGPYAKSGKSPPRRTTAGYWERCLQLKDPFLKAGQCCQFLERHYKSAPKKSPHRSTPNRGDTKRTFQTTQIERLPPSSRT